MADAMRGCDAVVSCLGHRLTAEGVYGEPRYMCRDAAELVVGRLYKLNPIDP
jgi:hypothetical protein